MRRAAMFTVVCAALVVAFAGVALAAMITCNGGRCEGTNNRDEITGSPLRDRIFALAGADQVEASAGNDELNGADGGDDLFGETENDTYIGGGGEDILRESLIIDEQMPPIILSNDEMNGGPSRDFIEGNAGDDILRGQGGSEHLGPTGPTMFGDQGDDKLFGGPGEDGMEGEEGTDEHYGGDNNDFINAVDVAVDPVTGDPVPVGTRDLVDCGSGFDTAVFNSDEDIVLGNCEEPIDTAEDTIVAPALVTTNEEQQQMSEAFESGNG
jgi:Ca2+-binding RTX toxin-like protein